MSFTAKALEDNAVELTIEISADELKKGEKKALKDIAGKINIPGFRKGKAPKDVVERQVGKDYVLRSAFDLIYPKAVNNALDEGNYNPVTRVEVDIVTLAEDENMVFTATFTDHPKVTLGQYKELPVEKSPVNITDEDVDKEVENFLYKHSDLADATDADTTAQWDLVTLDFEGFIDGEPFDGGKAEDYIIELGNGEFIEGFEEQLIGLKVGDEKEVNVTFPEDYRDLSLAGKPALFKCRIKSFKKRKFPELTDEFVAEKIPNIAKTVAEMKEIFKSRLQRVAAHDADNKQMNDAIELAAKNITVEIPEIMVEMELDTIMRTMELQLQEQNIDVDSYFSSMGMDAGQYREGQREQAEKSVRINLMLEAVAKEENIETTESDLTSEIFLMAMTYRVKPEEIVEVIKKQGDPAQRNLQLTALRKKVAQFIYRSIPGNEQAKPPEETPVEDAKDTNDEV